jgi:hypothetical protein
MTTETRFDGSSIQINECAACGHLNRPGTLVCDVCGTNLITGESAAITRYLEDEADDPSVGVGDVTVSDGKTLDVGKPSKTVRTGTSIFDANTVLRIYIEGVETPLLLRLVEGQQLVLGRRDTGGASVDVDFTTYGGYQRGISRKHATLELHNRRLEICDLNSSNGTFLNGVLLEAHLPQQLRDGDQIRLGHLKLHVVFQHKIERRA